MRCRETCLTDECTCHPHAVHELVSTGPGMVALRIERDTELGRIVRISSQRAYVVVETGDGERVRETPASFYATAPAIGDTLVRQPDGTLDHRPARVVTHNPDAPICGPKGLNDTLDRAFQALAERCRT